MERLIMEEICSSRYLSEAGVFLSEEQTRHTRREREAVTKLHSVLSGQVS